ncbi:g10538 [Coccomyxa elongata]
MIAWRNTRTNLHGTPFDRPNGRVSSLSYIPRNQSAENLKKAGSVGAPGMLKPTSSTGLPKAESIPPAPRSPGPSNTNFKKSDSVNSTPGMDQEKTQAAQAHLLKVRELMIPAADEPDEDQTEAFLLAAQRGNSTKVRRMLQHEGQPPDSSNFEGRTALMLAAMHGHRDVALALLGAGADPNVRDKEGSTALLKAVRNAHDSIVSLLRSCGAELDLPSTEAAAHLCTCVFDCNVPLLRRYIKAGISVNAGNFDKRTPLHVAAAEGNLAAVRVLVEEGKADLAVTDRWGATPLDEAMRVGSRATMDYLQGLNAPTQRDDDRTMEFLYAAARGDTTKLRHMIHYGFDVNKGDYDNRTALMLAVVGGHAAAVNTLLGAGADPNIQDNLGHNALLEAVKRGHDSLIRLLIDNDAKLGFDEIRSASELCTAAAQGNSDLIRRYIKAGINVNAADYDKRTALHIAAAEGNLDVVRVLLEDGSADFDARDVYSMDPLDEAMRHRHDEVAEYLRKSGALIGGHNPL